MILVIYEQIPEKTDVYMLPINELNVQMCKAINNKFINMDDLTEEEDHFITDIPNYGNKAYLPLEPAIKIDLVIITGWVM